MVILNLTCVLVNLHEGERCCVEEEGGSEAAEVVEVLQGMHGEAGEGLNVCVPVVDAVDVFVHGGNVDKSARSLNNFRVPSLSHIILYQTNLWAK